VVKYLALFPATQCPAACLFRIMACVECTAEREKVHVGQCQAAWASDPFAHHQLDLSWTRPFNRAPPLYRDPPTVLLSIYPGGFARRPRLRGRPLICDELGAEPLNGCTRVDRWMPVSDRAECRVCLWARLANVFAPKHASYRLSKQPVKLSPRREI